MKKTAKTNGRPVQYKDGLWYGAWAKDDIRRLKSLYPDMATSIVANTLGRPAENVKKKASRLHLMKSRKYRRQVLHLSK